jgi:hypothetical protein
MVKINCTVKKKYYNIIDRMCDSIACNNLPIYLQNVTVEYDPNVVIPYYTTVGLFPSNQSMKRLWNFSAAFATNMNIVDPKLPITLVYDFSNVQFEGTASFESPIFGSLQTRSNIYNAGKYISFTFDDEKKTLTFVITPPCRTSRLSYQLEIFDKLIGPKALESINYICATCTTKSSCQ